MTARRRAAAVLVVLAVAAVAAAAAVHTGGSDSGPAPSSRPAHVLDVTVGDIERIDVVAADGRAGRIERVGGRLAVVAGAAVPAARLRRLERDLAPLLAIRSFDGRRPAYGLDPPRLDVSITTARGPAHLRVGAANFDATAVYVAVGQQTALVLPRIAATLGMVVGEPSGQP